jgi:hypothetical protein
MYDKPTNALLTISDHPQGVNKECKRINTTVYILETWFVSDI